MWRPSWKVHRQGTADETHQSPECVQGTQQLECMFLVRFQCQGQTHITDMPSALAQDEPSGCIHAQESQQFISAGYDPCTKGMHKMVLPSARYT